VPSRPLGQCRSRSPSGFMVAARLALLLRPAQGTKRRSPKVDEEGWHLVVCKNKKRKSGRSPGHPGVVLADLVGLCFNCFDADHVACFCPNPSCFNCFSADLVACFCPNPMVICDWATVLPAETVV
jgi:hypothetical protein